MGGTTPPPGAGGGPWEFACNADLKLRLDSERQNVISGPLRTLKIELPCRWELNFAKSSQCAKRAKKAPKWDPFWGPGIGGNCGNRLFLGTFWSSWHQGMHFGFSARVPCPKMSSLRQKSHPKDYTMGPKLEKPPQKDDQHGLHLRVSVCNSVLFQEGGLPLR